VPGLSSWLAELAAAVVVAEEVARYAKARPAKVVATTRTSRVFRRSRVRIPDRLL